MQEEEALQCLTFLSDVGWPEASENAHSNLPHQAPRPQSLKSIRIKDNSSRLILSIKTSSKVEHPCKSIQIYANHINIVRVVMQMIKMDSRM